MQLSVTMPRPPKACFPNGGHGHWRGAWAAKKKLRTQAHLAMLESMSKAGVERADFTPRTYRIFYYYKGIPHDEDNILAACKAILDGCADAFGANDRTFRSDGIERIPAKGDPRCGTVTILFDDTDTKQQIPNEDTMKTQTRPRPAAANKKPTSKNQAKAARSSRTPKAAYFFFAIAWWQVDGKWHFDAALEKDKQHAGWLCPVLMQRAVSHGADPKDIYSSHGDIAGIINAVERGDGFPEPFGQARANEGYAATLAGLRDWLPLAQAGKADPHLATWQEKQAAPKRAAATGGGI